MSGILLYGQFRINWPPKLEIVSGALGGMLMGVGASLGGWDWLHLLSFAMPLVWYLLVRYNETTEKFTVF